MGDNTGLLERIDGKLDSIADVAAGLPHISRQLDRLATKVSLLPNEDRVRVIVSEERPKCPAYKNFEKIADRTAQNTGVLKTMRDSGLVRRSLAPAARAAVRLPIWAKVLIPTIVTAALGAFGLIQ